MASLSARTRLALPSFLVRQICRTVSRSLSAGNNETSSNVGIFLDAENLSQFISNNGGRRLLEIALEFGNPIVRKAYGNWSLPGLYCHQHTLIAAGFQLMHNPHPIAGKNAADIALAVDVMDVLHRMPAMKCFVLATGDSDFSSLFCHVRQSGRQVVGVGPRSVLSEIVKSSADRFVYIDPPPLSTSVGIISSQQLGMVDKEKPFELLERVLESLPSEEPVNASFIKDSMLRLDSAFNHKRFGFQYFHQFLQASKLVHIESGPFGARVTARKNGAH